MNEPITIRPACDHRDYVALQQAQRDAWALEDESYVVPIATLVGANRHGGLVLGAFLPAGRAVGLSFAFLGRVKGELCLYSQLTGIVPHARDRGLGTRLKLAQRDFALRSGLPAIAWAFDPLQAGNARFNLAKLGAHAAHYYENLYGERTDALNAGVPSDRLLAWWPVSPRPRTLLQPQQMQTLPKLVCETEGLPHVTIASCFHHVAALVEIPDDIATLRREQPTTAAAWVAAFRTAFSAVFAAGWRAIDVVELDVEGRRRKYYRVEPR